MKSIKLNYSVIGLFVILMSVSQLFAQNNEVKISHNWNNEEIKIKLKYPRAISTTSFTKNKTYIESLNQTKWVANDNFYTLKTEENTLKKNIIKTHTKSIFHRNHNGHKLKKETPNKITQDWIDDPHNHKAKVILFHF